MFGARLATGGRPWCLGKSRNWPSMVLHLWPQKAETQEEKQGWSRRLGHLGQGQLSRHRRGLHSTGVSLERQGSPESMPLWKGQPTQLGQGPGRAGISWVMGRPWITHPWDMPDLGLQSFPPEQAEELGVAGTQRPQLVLPLPHHDPGINILETEKGSSWGEAIRGKESRAGRKGPRTWMVTSTPQPQAGPSLLGSATSAVGMQLCNQFLKPPHCTAPTPPVPLIHMLTSPNRPPLPETKITIFKIHSRAFAYTRCTDWKLKGDMQNAVCG